MRKYTTEQVNKAWCRYYNEPTPTQQKNGEFYFDTGCRFAGDDQWEVKNVNYMDALLSPHYETLLKIKKIREQA